MGVPVSEYDVTQRDNSVAGEELQAKGGYLYFVCAGYAHPIRVMATTHKIRVGCTTITREAWELLKRKIDGERA